MSNVAKEVPNPDTEVNETKASSVEDSKTDYLEFVGTEPYGTEFYKGDAGTHSITKAQMKANHDIDLGAKEVVWRKGSNGRMLVNTSDMSPEAVDVLADDPMFRRVSL
jgi:hypothetical protein